jgi:hypothetical protein
MNTTTVINGNVVDFIVDQENTVCFSINGSYKYQKNNKDTDLREFT